MKRKVLSTLVLATLAMVMVSGCAAKPAATSAPAVSEAAPAESDAAPAPAASETAPAASETAPVAELPGSPDNKTIVDEAAMGYFANFPDDKNVIVAKDLFVKMDAKEDMMILDIRKADDYNKGHLVGAVNAPFGSDVSAVLETIPNDRPIYVYCYTGQTSSQTAALLNVAGKTAKTVQSGFTNGISKESGFEKYINTDAVAFPKDVYPVEPAVLEAEIAYFAAVDAAVGTSLANLNISAADTNKLIGDPAYMFLDVRQAEDFKKGHIKSSSNIPFAKGMEQQFATLPKDKTIIVSCYSGQTASQTVGILRLLGYDAYNLSGGMGKADPKSGWLGEGFEVVTD